MLLSVLVVCAGVTVATVTDKVVISNMMGLFVGLAATGVTALYQVRACICVRVLCNEWAALEQSSMLAPAFGFC